MKSLIRLLLLNFLQYSSGQHFLTFRRGIPPPDEPGYKLDIVDPDWGWITQKLDHFNTTDSRTWEMRYMNNSFFFQAGGPMFVFIGGEWKIGPGYLKSGQMFDMAVEHRAYMFYTEHRYYGESHPTEDLSVENLRYLSSEQALVDLAYFIERKKETIPGLRNSKVVVFGGSYSGALATWARLKYPHLIDGALSSSAPLRAVADFYEYYEVVSDSLGQVTRRCVDVIKEAMVQIDKLLESPEGVEYLSGKFKTCHELKISELERSYFFDSLASPFASIVQYAKGSDLNKTCETILSSCGKSVDKLSGSLDAFYGNYCISGYDSFINYYNNTNFTENIFRQWLYQSCTEFGFFQTASSLKQPFINFGLDLFVRQCRDLFGLSEDILNDGIKKTNALYGSTQLNVTRVISVHGTVDPWHAAGMLEDLGPESPVIVVKGSSHCADLPSVKKGDSEELKRAKLKVKEVIAEWLK